MSKVIFLDTGPLGFAVHPKAKISGSTQSNFMQWLLSCLENGKTICIPEISDYELRRSLIKINSIDSITKLNELKNSLEYIPINTATMLKAAEFWAETRIKHQPTASDEALDGDLILCAQAQNYSSDVIIATTNVKHLKMFANAEQWESIIP